MSIANDYSDWINQTAWYKHKGEGNQKEIGYLITGLAGESGEVADVFKKLVRETGFDDTELFDELVNDYGRRKELIDELGDVMWYVTAMCNALGITVEELMVYNACKIHDRLTKGAWNTKEIQERLGLHEEALEWPLGDISHKDAIGIYEDITNCGVDYDNP